MAQSEPAVTESERTANDTDTTRDTDVTDTKTEEERNKLLETDAAEWFASSALRAVLVLVGLVLLLVAVGEVAGADLLGLTVDALSSSIGRWVVVAAIGLVIIAIAARGFDGETA